MARELMLYEEMLLLALDDDTGKTSFVSMHAFALGGAVLAELLLRNAVRIVQEKRRRFVEIASGAVTGDPLLDECLNRVRDSKRRQVAATWVTRFAHTKDLGNRVAERLRQKGVLRREDGRFLLVFTRRQYPTVDPGPETDLRQRMQTAIEGDGTIDGRTAIAISLASSTGLLDRNFDKALLKRRKERLKQLRSGEAVGAGQATKEAIEAAQAAIAATAAVIAATSVTTST